jgi:hypothetical protein
MTTICRHCFQGYLSFFADEILPVLRFLEHLTLPFALLYTLKKQCHHKCMPDKHTDIVCRNMIKLIDPSQQYVHFFKDYLQEGKSEKQLNSGRAHWLHGKICQNGYLQPVKSSPLGVLHMEVQLPSLYKCAALRQYSSRASWRRYCSLPLRRVHGIKRMHLASCTHGLFIT